MFQRQNTVQQFLLAILPLTVSWLSVLGFIGSGALKFPIIYTVMLVLAYLLMSEGRALKRFPVLSFGAE
jgi:hypothetical protein